jgi:hypothetical protein
MAGFSSSTYSLAKIADFVNVFVCFYIVLNKRPLLKRGGFLLLSVSRVFAPQG